MVLGRSCGDLGRSWGGLGWSWSHLGSILSHLGRAWGHLEAVSSRLGEPKTLIFLRFFNVFFAKSKFPTKIVILARLEAILEPLGTILVPLGAVLGLPGGRQGGRRSSTNVRGARKPTVRGPPPPKLLAKANSD